MLLKRKSLLWWPFVLLVLLASCGKPPQSDMDQIQRHWVYTSSSAHTTDTTGFLAIKYDRFGAVGTFSQSYGSGQDTLTGTWVLNDSLLVLTYAAEPVLMGIDSAYYEISENQPSVILLEDGNEVARIGDGSLSSINESVTFEVDSLGPNVLHISHAEERAALSYTPTVMETQITFMGILRGLLGLLVLLGIAWLFSSNRKAIDWKLVGKGILFQLILAIMVLKVPFIADVFDAISAGFVKVISFAGEGAEFLLAQFGTDKIQAPLLNFLFTILPTIIFFSALTSLLYYYGILQKVVYGLAWVMKRVMKLSGAESLAAAGNIFLGQTEAPLLIKPYLKTMTKSEMMCLMSGGMATIAGGVLAAYISFLGGDDPAQQLFFAKHLLAASVMSAPAAIVASKMLVPETEEINPDLKISKDKIGANVLEAIANGTTDGVKLAVNVAAMLLVFIALMALLNGGLHGIGDITGLNGVLIDAGFSGGLTFQLLLGWIGAPLAWCMGVPTEDIFLVGQLLGEKTVINEFIAYNTLGKMKADGLFHSEKSIIMATYVLCGFANFASIGIQIGGIGALVPERKALLSKLGMRALIGGTLACLFTAVIVGMLM